MNAIPTALAQSGLRPGRLWSLLEMLRVYADKYIILGRQLVDGEQTLQAAELRSLLVTEKESEAALTRMGFHLSAMATLCEELDLATSRTLIEKRLTDPPQSKREFELLVDAIFAELEGKLFLFVPPHRAKYYGLVLQSTVSTAFPRASQEMVEAGNGIATEMFTASVFHSMRAVEIGLQAMAKELGVVFSYPLELAEWGKIVGELEPKINDLKAGPRSTQKDEDLRFYSEAASQFRHFNNGWRIRASHARASFDESQAIRVFDHTLSFFQTLSERLKEEEKP